MKCLSLIQPYASLVLSGIKRYETRKWDPTSQRVKASNRLTLPTRILIHASATPIRHFQNNPNILASEVAIRKLLKHLDLLLLTDLPRGVILGSVQVVSVAPSETLKTLLDPEQLALGHFDPKWFGWQLTNPVLLSEPIPYKGTLGLFEVPMVVVAGSHLQRQLFPDSLTSSVGACTDDGEKVGCSAPESCSASPQ